MTQFWTYRNAIDASPTWSVSLGAAAVRLGQLPGLTEVAEHLQSGSCQVVFDDPTGTLGHSSDAIIGQQRIEVTDTACSAPRVYTGFVGIRTYQRGDGSRPSLVTGVSRQIGVELHDYNAYASFRVMPQTYRTAIRPRETVNARFAWITGTGYLAAVSDTGYVASNTTMMDKTDYRGQRPVNVLNDCELAAGFGWNCFIFWDDAASGPAWFFDNANTSTAFSSTLRISNVLSDLDTTTAATFLTGTTFAPSKDARLTRDPTELGDSAYMPYRNGAVFRTRAATTATYGQKDIIAPNANVGSKTRAQAMADDFLFQHRNEEDRITLTVELPPSKVNLIKAGHRILVKFSHLPGYESFTWCRVLRRAPAQTQQTDDRYTMELELSPQECTGTESDISLVQSAVWNGGGAGTNLPSAPTVGNLMVVAVGNRDEISLGPISDPPPSGWTRVPLIPGQSTPSHAIQAQGTCACGHGDLIYRVVQAGDTGIAYPDSQCAGIIAEFAGAGNTAITAARGEDNSVASGSISFASGAPGVPALVVAAVITRLLRPGTIIPSGSTHVLPAAGELPYTNINGGGTPALLWGFSSDGSAFTFTGSQSGSGKDGFLTYGIRTGAFTVCDDG